MRQRRHRARGSERVKASAIRCKRAKRLARKFIRKDQIRDGWKVTNPAGCEFLMFRKRDADEFGEVPEPKSGVPLIFFTKTVGCVSGRVAPTGANICRNGPGWTRTTAQRIMSPLL